MADLATQVADMNASAKSLLTKYDGAFSKLEDLSEEKQKELNDLVSSKLKEIDKIKEDMGNQTVDIDVDKIKAEIDKKVKSALDEIDKVSGSSKLLWTGNIENGNITLNDSLSKYKAIIFIISFNDALDSIRGGWSCPINGILKSKYFIVSTENDRIKQIDDTHLNFAQGQADNHLLEVVGV